MGLTPPSYRQRLSTQLIMKAVIQRCHQASVTVHGEVVGKIKHGLVVFLGVAENDDQEKAQKLAAKIVKLRIFNDENGRFNRSLLDVNGEILVISNFTLCGDAQKGNRPSFMQAAEPAIANQLYESFVKLLLQHGLVVQKGIFGADMTVDVSNSGPVTLTLEMP